MHTISEISTTPETVTGWDGQRGALPAGRVEVEAMLIGEYEVGAVSK